MKPRKTAWQQGVQDRAGPSVRELGPGPGPYGSWNEEEPKGDIEDDEKWLLRNVSAADDRFDEIYGSDTQASVLSLATSRLNSHLNCAVGRSIRENHSREFFKTQATTIAQNTVEDAVHAAALELGIFEIGTLSPLGITRLMNHFLTGSELLIETTRERLVESYQQYLASRDEVST